MKKGRLISALALGLLVVGAGASAAFNSADVASLNATAEAETTWSLIGYGSDLGDWDKDTFFTKEGEKYTLTHKFSGDTYFKARKDKDWNSGVLGYRKDYFPSSHFATADDNGNIQYNSDLSAWVTLTIGKDKDNKWAWIDEIVIKDTDAFNVKVMYGDEVLREDKVRKGAKFKDKFIYKEDLYYEGLFTDKELKNAFNFDTPVSSDLTLYAKYTPVGDDKDQILFVANSNITKLHTWQDGIDGRGTDWTKPILAKDANKEGIKYFVIPVEYKVTHIILRDDSHQSANISLTNAEAGYTCDDEVFYITSNYDGKADKIDVTIDGANTKAMNEFLKEFRNVRTTNGYVEEETTDKAGICDVTSDSALVTKYNALDNGLKPLLKNVNDHHNHSVLDTMEYVINRVTAGQKTNSLDTNVNNDEIIVITALSCAVVAVAAISLIVIAKRKRETI